MEAKLKHLEIIQGVITRMAQNSFLLKGWSVTLTAALFALAAKDANTRFVVIALLPALVFWGLDGYFLRQERLFRKVYDQVRVRSPELIDFSMDTRSFQQEVAGWFAVTTSNTLLAFHLPVVLVIGSVGVYFYSP
ncbi:MAG: hypothetical protein ABW166_12740 [Sedimenticola sp.]